MMFLTWLLMAILAFEACAWLAYGALKALNGILREIEILRMYKGCE